MNDSVRLTHHEGVLVADWAGLTALDAGAALAGIVARVESDAALVALVLVPCDAGWHSAPELGEQLRLLEDCGKPVVAALAGDALGGALEVALACHYRVAAGSARLGLPGVKAGLMPGAGATQRLPRLAGLERALEMCAFGEPLTAQAAYQCGLLDRLAERDAVEEAIALARQTRRVRRTRELQGELMDAAATESLAALCQDACRRRMRGQNAPLAAVDAVAATARLSFDAGLELERKLYQECRQGTQARAFEYVQRAEAAVVRDAAAHAPAHEPITLAAVVGAGTMGVGIAMCYAGAGIPVLLKDETPGALERGMAAIERNYAHSVARGRLSPDEAARRAARITPTLSYDGFAEAGVVVEAVYEELALKRHVFAELDRVARPGAILATNTGTIDIDEIAAATRRPEAVVGHHFFNPAQVMRLLEVVRGQATAEQTVAASLELAERLGKLAVAAGNTFGFIGNRMFGRYRIQAIQMAEEGASPFEIDRAMTEWGMAMGPLAVSDLLGLDVQWQIRQEARRRRVAHVPASCFEDELYNLGRLGQKNGAGWFVYDEERKAHPDAEVERLLREYAAWQGIEQRRFTPAGIRERLLCALINEGARLLEEGHARRPSDIDVVFTCGYGFPMWRGGPLHYAGVIGLKAIVERMERLHDEFGPVWRPAAPLEQLAAEGRTFDDWRR